MAQSFQDLVNSLDEDTLKNLLGDTYKPQASEGLKKRSVEDQVPYHLETTENQENTPQEEDPSAPPPPATEAAAPPTAEDTANDTNENDNDEDESEEEVPQVKSVPASASQVATPAEQASTPSSTDLLNFGNTQQNQSGLEQALAERRKNLAEAQMVRGSELLGAGLRRGTPVTSGSDELYKQAGLPVEEYALRQQAEDSNPNSGISQGLRDYIKKLGVNVSDGATAAQIKQVLPMVYKDLETKQNTQAREQQLKERLAERQQEAKDKSLDRQSRDRLTAQLRNQSHQDKMAQQQQVAADKLSHQNDANALKIGAQLESVRGDKALQNAKESIRRVASANQILAHYPDLNQVPPNIASAITTDLGTIIQGGQLGEAGYNELATPTLYSRLAKGAQEVINKPTGANLGAFLKQNQSLLNELKGTAEEQVNDKYRRVLNTQGKLLDPAARENYRMQYLPQDKADEHGMYQGTQTAHGFGLPGGAGITLPPDARQKALDELKRRGIQ